MNDFIIRFDANEFADVIVCSRQTEEGELLGPVVYQQFSRPVLSVLPRENQEQWVEAEYQLGWKQPSNSDCRYMYGDIIV